jgi:methyl-galactoside transport system ATP-binding protein
LLEAIFGLRTISAGKIVYQGRSLHFANAKDAMEHGFALITEERKLNGMFAKADLTFNTTITNLDKYKKLGVLSFKKMKDATKQEIKVMNTKCMDENDLITALSGGNQQKVIISKWIERSPDVFLMDEPTRGIDVLAKYQIYELMNKMASEGKIIVMVSSEMPEILGVTNRIAVMSNHRLAGIVETKKTNQEELLRLCAKYL